MSEGLCCSSNISTALLASCLETFPESPFPTMSNDSRSQMIHLACSISEGPIHQLNHVLFEVTDFFWQDELLYNKCHLVFVQGYS